MTKKEKLALAKNKPVEEPKTTAPVADEVEGEPEDTTSSAPLPQNDEVKPEPKVEKAEGEVVYQLKSGQIRKFTKELHGADYKKVAEAFKNNGKNLVAREL